MSGSIRTRIVAAFLCCSLGILGIAYFVSTSEMRSGMAAVVIVAATVVLAYVAAALISSSLARRLRRLREYSEALARMEITQIPPDFGDDEIGDLARSLRDIAPELRKLAERLSEELARSEAILTSMIEGVLVVDPTLRVNFCNDAFARAVGASAEELRGTSILHFVRDPALIDMLKRVLEGRQPVSDRRHLSGVQGRTFHIQAAPLNSATTSGAVVLLHDVSDLERLERIRKDFVANVSHEFRTPLAAIRGYAETLLDGGLDDLQNRRKFVEIIESHAMRLNLIASDLLVLSDLESGRPLPNPEPVSVRESMETAVRSVESEARLRGVEVQYEPPAEDFQLAAMKVRLEQVLINLLDNAVKFNRPGGSVRISAHLNGNDQGYITVSDTGIGIPSEDLPRIFERFYRVDKARSRAVGGTGLGLSIVKHAIDQMRGTVSVESTLGRGSQFTITLPVLHQEAASTAD